MVALWDEVKDRLNAPAVQPFRRPAAAACALARAHRGPSPEVILMDEPALGA